MLPSEMIILMAISVNKDTGKQLLNRPVDVASEYIGYLYNSLVSRGYLKQLRSKGYKLTPAGRETILRFIKNNRTRADDVVKRLRLLGIELSPEQERKMDKIEKESIRVK